MVGNTPLAAARDNLIERWLRNVPMEKGNKTSRVWLPQFGKPKAVKRGKPKLGGSGPSPYRRRVVVISYFYKMAKDGYSKLHSHLNYIERPGAGEEALTPRMFNDRTDTVAGHSEIKEWRDDRHHWRIILSPADGGKMDMVEYTKAFMDRLEQTLGTKLEWMAGVHEKPDGAHEKNRHVHIVIRGIASDGSDLVISREVIKHEFRRIAEELATDRLGQMSQRELDAYLSRQAERERTGERNYNSGRRPTRQEAEYEYD